jgi:ribosomal protein L24
LVCDLSHCRARRKLPEPIKYSAGSLQKSFNEGDHVKVTQGKYKGHTGLIVAVKVKAGTVKLVSDTDQSKHFEVFCHQLIAASADDRGGGQATLGNGKYRLLDLVSLYSDPQAIGVIVKIERSVGTILTVSGKRNVPSNDIKRKVNTMGILAYDQRSQVIKLGCEIRVSVGIRKGQAGTVEHVYHNAVFVRSKIAVEDCGMMVIPPNQVCVLGAIGHGVGRAGAMEGGRGGRGRGGRGRGRGRGRGAVELPQGLTDRSGVEMMFETHHVKIIRGTHKGYVGRIVSTSETQCTIQLDSRGMNVTVGLRERNGNAQIKPRDREDINGVWPFGSGAVLSVERGASGCFRVSATPTPASAAVAVAGSRRPVGRDAPQSIQRCAGDRKAYGQDAGRPHAAAHAGEREPEPARARCPRPLR